MARTEMVNIRLDIDELAAIGVAAQQLGITVSEYVRKAAMDTAGQVCPKCGGTGRVAGKR